MALVLPETSASSFDWIRASPEDSGRVVDSSSFLLFDGGTSATATGDDTLALGDGWSDAKSWPWTVELEVDSVFEAPQVMVVDEVSGSPT